MATPESKVKKKVNKALKPFIDSGRAWKFMAVQTGYGMPGLDYFLCAGGTFIAVETKVKGKEMTERQKTTARAICGAGGRVFMVDDEVSLAAVVDELEYACQYPTDGRPFVCR